MPHVQLQLAMSSSCSSLTVDSCVHEYSVIWEPVIREELQCGAEIDNSHDVYAVSMQVAACGTCPSDPVQCFCRAMA